MKPRRDVSFAQVAQRLFATSRLQEANFSLSDEDECDDKQVFHRIKSIISN